MEKTIVNKIIETKDTNTFCSLNVSDMEDCFMELQYQHFSDMKFEELNDIQKTIFLCLVLEDHCQSDGILSLTEESDLFFLLPQMKQALLDIKAQNTAAALQDFIDLLPEETFENHIIPEWNWFKDSERRTVIEEIDDTIIDYPDGLLRELYRDFILSNPGAASELLQL